MPLVGFWYFSSVGSSTILDTVNLTALLTQLFYFLDFYQFIPPRSRVNTKFFRDKPTLRLVREKSVLFSEIPSLETSALFAQNFLEFDTRTSSSVIFQIFLKKKTKKRVKFLFCCSKVLLNGSKPTRLSLGNTYSGFQSISLTFW